MLITGCFYKQAKEDLRIICTSLFKNSDNKHVLKEIARYALFFFYIPHAHAFQSLTAVYMHGMQG